LLSPASPKTHLEWISREITIHAMCIKSIMIYYEAKSKHLLERIMNINLYSYSQFAAM
jgi:hypothetical protein